MPRIKGILVKDRTGSSKQHSNDKSKIYAGNQLFINYITLLYVGFKC